MQGIYRSAYARIKEEHKVIDFDDMEASLSGNFRRRGGNVLISINEKFVEIMVEFNFRTAMMFKTS